MTLDEIQWWTVLSGIGCIVTSRRGDWLTTACGSWRTGSVIETLPKRICRRCREAAPGLFRAGSKEDA